MKQGSGNEDRSIGAFQNKDSSFTVECKPHVIYQKCLDKIEDHVVRVPYHGTSGHLFATSMIANKPTLKVTDAKPLATSVFNSRPHCSAYGVIITPVHFTVGEPLTALPPVGGKGTSAFNGDPINIVQHTKRVNGFWLYWRKSYLMQLPSVHINPRNKGHILAVGDVVMPNDPSKDRSSWQVGTVTKVYPPGNGVIRSAGIKVDEDRKERTAPRSTGRLVSLEEAKEHTSMGPSDTVARGEDVATSDATAPADTNFTDGKDYSGDTDGIELDEEE